MKIFYSLIVVLLMTVMGLHAQDNIRFFSTGYDTANFENLVLAPGSYWNGSDESGGFTSGSLYFLNDYDPEWGSWTGWGYSNMADDTTQGFMNQYSAITASGYDTLISGGSNYGVGYVPADWMSSETIPISIYIDDSVAHKVMGFYATNSTYTALSMEYGDSFSKKFGGETGDDPDWYKLSIWGYLNGIETDTVEFYLADYRFANNGDDYIVKTWEWVELSTLGDVDSLKLDLSSTDVGIYGMNTPAYFCVDNLLVVPFGVGVDELQQSEQPECSMYPNPSNGRFRIQIENGGNASIRIFGAGGNQVYAENDYKAGEEIDISDHPFGIYIVQVIQNGKLSGSKILKK